MEACGPIGRVITVAIGGDMYKTILVPLDGSPGRRQAVPIASQIATAMGARVVLMQAVYAQGEGSDALVQQQARLTQTALADLEPLARAMRAEGLVVSVATPATRPEDAIPLEIELDNVDLVVMTTRARSLFGRWVFGSVAEAVLTQTHTPVLLVRMSNAQGSAAYPLHCTRFLVPLDGSVYAEAALPHAVALARAFDGQLRLLCVVALPKGQGRGRLPSEEAVATVSQGIDRANHYLESLASSLRVQGLTVDLDVQVGEAAATILDEGRDCSAIIMTTHGSTGLTRLTAGTVAMEVLKRGDHPVLVVRPKSLQAHGSHSQTHGDPAIIHS